MEAMPKEARGLIILATAVVFRAARMIAKVAEERGHISFKEQ